MYIYMARGPLKMKRCPNGTRRNKKTKKCVRRLNPKAKTFTMKTRLNPKAKTFTMKSRLNPKAKTFTMKSRLNPKAKTFTMKKSSPKMKCQVVNQKKYVDRPSPSIPAPTCNIGTKKKGSDGKMWVVVPFRNSKRWQRVKSK